jgi:type IV pilus assembly protein PilF
MNKAFTTLMLFALVIMSCTGTGSPQKSERLALAYKKEGDVFQSQGNYTAALAKLLQAEKILPDNARIQNSLGLAYMGKQRDDLAEQAFKKALKIEPDFTEAKNNLGAVYLRQEKWDIAIAQFETVLKDLVYPTPQFPMVNIGWAYLGKKEYPQAQAYFRKALEKSPGFITALHGQSQVFLQTGQTDRAIAFLHRKLRRTPDAAILHADLARAYEKKGQLRQAINAWELVMKLTPENTTLHRTAQARLDALQY